MTEFIGKDSIFTEGIHGVNEEIREWIRERGYDVQDQEGELVFTLSGNSWNPKEVEQIFLCMEEVGRKNQGSKKILRIFVQDYFNSFFLERLEDILKKAETLDQEVYFVISTHNIESFQGIFKSWREKIAGIEIMLRENKEIFLIKDMEGELVKIVEGFLDGKRRVYFRVYENENTLANLANIFSTIDRSGLAAYENFQFQLVGGEVESRIYYIIDKNGNIYPYPERKGLTQYGIGIYFTGFFVETLGNCQTWVSNHLLTCAY